ncbi:MAG: hypothetical protein M9909_13520 [Thermomicrobiales bacterium]|nr:hypothetical protein [Thermomicrobiales bacterium]
MFDGLESILLDVFHDTNDLLTILPPLDPEPRTHLYDHPPAAQGMPEIAAILWEHGRPLLDDAMLGYQIGKYLRTVATRFWHRCGTPAAPPATINKTSRGRFQEALPIWTQPRITWTQGALVALVIADLVERVGFQSDLEVDSHARGMEGFDTPDHPNSRITYLMRLAYAGEQYGYVVNSTGIVSEYFRIERSELVSLPTPTLLISDPDGSVSQPLDDKMRLRMH